jgi:hypothetical protein
MTKSVSFPNEGACFATCCEMTRLLTFDGAAEERREAATNIKSPCGWL